MFSCLLCLVEEPHASQPLGKLHLAVITLHSDKHPATFIIHDGQPDSKTFVTVVTVRVIH